VYFGIVAVNHSTLKAKCWREYQTTSHGLVVMMMLMISGMGVMSGMMTIRTGR
jgi:hypothetical protein